MTAAKVLPADTLMFDSTEAPSHPRDAMEARMTCSVWFMTVLLSPMLAIAFVLRVLLLLVTCFVLMPLSMALPRRCALRMLPTIGRLLYLAFGVYPGMIRVHGKQADVPILVAAPHCGMLEVLFGIYFCKPMPRPVMMETYAKMPIVGHFFRLLGGLAVPLPPAGSRAEAEAHKRQQQQQQQQQQPVYVKAAEEATSPPPHTRRSAAIREAISHHKMTWRPGEPPVVITPEGTTANGKVLVRFFSGAFEGGGVVQPVLVQYPFVYRNAAAWLHSGVGSHLRSLLLNPWQMVVVTFLPPTQPATAEEEADAAVYAERVRVDMAAAGGLPLSHYTAKMLRDEDRKFLDRK